MKAKIPAKIEFDLLDEDDKKALKRMLNADAAHEALHEIAQRVFRPNRKHGYDQDIEKLRDDKGFDLVDKLEDLFYEILEEKGVNVDD